MPGAGLSWLMRGKAPPEMPAFQPYRGKPAVRNDREASWPKSSRPLAASEGDFF
jgi:hypothetical protein